VTILVLLVLLGLIPAAVAHGKGRSFIQWWMFGVLLFVIALPMAILLKPMTEDEREAWQAGKITPRVLWHTLLGR
jgi:hypothetical protein